MLNKRGQSHILTQHDPYDFIIYLSIYFEIEITYSLISLSERLEFSTCLRLTRFNTSNFKINNHTNMFNSNPTPKILFYQKCKAHSCIIYIKKKNILSNVIFPRYYINNIIFSSTKIIPAISLLCT